MNKTLSVTHNSIEYTRTTDRLYTHVAIVEAEGRTPIATWHLTEKAAQRSVKFQGCKTNAKGATLYRHGSPIRVSIGTRIVIAL